MPEDGTIHILGRIEAVHHELLQSQSTVQSSLEALLQAVDKSDKMEQRWEARFSDSQQRWASRCGKLEDRLAALEDQGRLHAGRWATVGAVITPIRAIVISVITAGAIYYLIG